MAPIHREVGMANPARSMTAEPRCVVDMTVIMYRSTAALHSHTVSIELSASSVYLGWLRAVSYGQVLWRARVQERLTVRSSHYVISGICNSTVVFMTSSRQKPRRAQCRLEIGAERVPAPQSSNCFACAIKTIEPGREGMLTV